MTTQLRMLCALVGATLVAGCSGGSNEDGGAEPDLAPGPDTTPATTSDTASNTCGSPAALITTDGLCNNVPFPTQRIPFTIATGSAPTFTGGALIDGLYAAVKAEGWNVSTGLGRQMGIVIADGGTTMLWFGQTLNRDGSGDVDAGTVGLGWLRGNFKLSMDSANTLALAQDCFAGAGTSAPTTLLYTATTTTPPQLILAAESNPSGAVTTYERQGCP
jgi:hypothetical protein